jgi:hypothetical protein
LPLDGDLMRAVGCDVDRPRPIDRALNVDPSSVDLSDRARTRKRPDKISEPTHPLLHAPTMAFST